MGKVKIDDLVIVDGHEWKVLGLGIFPNASRRTSALILASRRSRRFNPLNTSPRRACSAF